MPSCSLTFPHKEALANEPARVSLWMVAAPQMLGKAKEINVRFQSPSDGFRLFNKALELLASNAAESEHELLELVKKAKRDSEKELPPPLKKAATGRGVGEVPELQSFGHHSMVVPVPSDHAGGQQAGISVESGAGSLNNPILGTTPVAVGHSQTRLINVARSGSGRGRVEKPKRKIGR
eukprot:c23367_g1_i1 orf=171-707(+)